MFNRSERALKILCGAVGALVLYRLVMVAVHLNPLSHVTIPQLPTLPAAGSTANALNRTNSPAHAATVGTNSLRQAFAHAVTNGAAPATNLVSGPSNLVGYAKNGVSLGTNSAGARANLLAQTTNTFGQTSNTAAHATNSAAGKRDTNQAPSSGPASKIIGLGARPGAIPGRPPGVVPGMPPGQLPGMSPPAPALPPEIQARVNRVIDSEILAPIMRPLPMALLGIAGNTVFFRAPNGQTGLIKQGEELGGVKLVRIGVNRVLVEEQGEQKELTIFAGLGGESLVSTTKNSSK